MALKGPYRLCTVNTTPERAKRLVGRVVEDMKDSYTIQHVENAAGMFLIGPFQRLLVCWSCGYELRSDDHCGSCTDIQSEIAHVKDMCERNKPDVLVG